MGYADQFPEFTQKWKDQNGEENALHDALLGAEAMPATTADFLDYLERAFTTGMGILRNIANQQ